METRLNSPIDDTPYSNQLYHFANNPQKNKGYPNLVLDMVYMF